MIDTRVDPSEAELVIALARRDPDEGRLTADQLRLARLVLHTRGYLILRNAVPANVYREARRCFDEVFADCVDSKQGDDWYQVARATGAVFWERNHRWRIFPKLTGIFANPSLITPPAVLSVLHSTLGEDFFCKFVSSDTCLRGAEIQSPHRELGSGRAWEPCAYVVNVPLGPCGLDNGPLEVWPGSGHLWRSDLLDELGLDTDVQDARNPDCEAFCALFPSRRIELQPGDILIRDPGLLHRGTVNRTDTPRSMMTIAFFRRGHWHDYGDASFNLDRECWLKLCDTVRPLFAYAFAD